MRIAQILYGQAHWIFETNETIEQVRTRFAPGLVFVDITDRPEVQEDWNYDGKNFTAPIVSEEQQKASILYQIEVLESKQARAIREIMLYVNDADNQDIFNTAKAKLIDYEAQIKSLRSQLD